MFQNSGKLAKSQVFSGGFLFAKGNKQCVKDRKSSYPETNRKKLRLDPDDNVKTIQTQSLSNKKEENESILNRQETASLNQARETGVFLFAKSNKDQSQNIAKIKILKNINESDNENRKQGQVEEEITKNNEYEPLKENESEGLPKDKEFIAESSIAKESIGELKKQNIQPYTSNSCSVFLFKKPKKKCIIENCAMKKGIPERQLDNEREHIGHENADNSGSLENKVELKAQTEENMLELSINLEEEECSNRIETTQKKRTKEEANSDLDTTIELVIPKRKRKSREATTNDIDDRCKFLGTIESDGKTYKKYSNGERYIYYRNRSDVTEDEYKTCARCSKRLLICEGNFKNHYTILVSHVMAHLKDLKLFRCKQCGQEFSKRCFARAHLKAVHDGAKLNDSTLDSIGQAEDSAKIAAEFDFDFPTFKRNRTLNLLKYT